MCHPFNFSSLLSSLSAGLDGVEEASGLLSRLNLAVKSSKVSILEFLL